MFYTSRIKLKQIQ